MQAKQKISEAKERVLLVTKIKSHTKSDDFVEVQFAITKNMIKIFFRNQLLREIPLSSIDAITYSLTSSQFILHIKNDIDERFSSISHRQEIIEMILYLLTVVNQKLNSRIKFFPLEERDLTLFVTSEEDLEDQHLLRPEIKFLTLINYKDFLKLTNKKKHLELRKPNSFKKVASVGDFELLKVLGKGAHGKVLLCSLKNRPTAQFAMKILKKQHIIDAKQLEHTIAEKMILTNVNHPFLVSMKYTFQTEAKLYFVMEFMKGGELFQHLKKNVRFSEEQTKFLCACLVLALGHLHNSNYIYRDLKPENILLDEKGYAKLSDFGLAKEVRISDVANTFCGTPEYLAPEVIMSKGCNRPADWWSLGIVVYEMLFAVPPFYSTDVQEMYKKTILKKLKFPSNTQTSLLAMDFISGLLVKKPEDRLGSIADSLEVMNHPWLQDINWSKLLAKKLDPPYKPIPSDWETNFDPEFIKEDVRDSKCEINSNLIHEYRQKFEKFDIFKPRDSTIVEKLQYSSTSLGKIFKTQFEKHSPHNSFPSFSTTESNLKSIKLVTVEKPIAHKSENRINIESEELNTIDFSTTINNKTKVSGIGLTKIKEKCNMYHIIDDKLNLKEEKSELNSKLMFAISEEKDANEGTPKMLSHSIFEISNASLEISSSNSNIIQASNSYSERLINL